MLYHPKYGTCDHKFTHLCTSPKINLVLVTTKCNKIIFIYSLNNCAIKSFTAVPLINVPAIPNSSPSDSSSSQTGQTNRKGLNGPDLTRPNQTSLDWTRLDWTVPDQTRPDKPFLLLRILLLPDRTGLD